MKAIILVALVLAFSSQVLGETCPALGRANTVWLGVPGQDGASTDSMLVRVFRTDKFGFEVDKVDARVAFSDNSLTKVKPQELGRSTPEFDDTEAYTLVNDSRVVVVGEEAFMVLKELRPGVFEIMFRSLYSQFPMTVVPGTNNAWWVSEVLSSFYFVAPDGQMVIVQDIAGDRRDFNSSTSIWTTLDISADLRNTSTPQGTISKFPPSRLDTAQVIRLNYGTGESGTCSGGSAVFEYGNSTMRYIGDQEFNTGYWTDPWRKWWAHVDGMSVHIIDYTTNTTVYEHTFSDQQLEKIISRLALGAWLGPLVALGALWVSITLFCAVFCRHRC